MTAESARTYARIAGLLLLLSMIGGGFGEGYVPAKIIVQSDAALTAKNIVASESLVRIGFAAYLVEAICDIALSLLFYVLLRPVHRDTALLAAFFGLVSTAVFAVAELFFFASMLIVRNVPYLNAFSADQRNALVLLAAKAYTLGGSLFLAFYGIAWLLRAALMLRSGYFPKFLGLLMGLAGAGFVVKNFLVVLSPRYASDFLILPMLIGALSLMVWLLAKGVDTAKWDARSQATADAR